MICTKCNVDKPPDDFSRDKRRSTGRYPHCKACARARLKAYRASPKGRACTKAYNESPEAKARVRAYRASPAGKARATVCTSAYTRHRRATDPAFRLAGDLRARLRRALHGRAKRGSAIRDLGCTIPEMKRHLEELFAPGMTWDNHSLHGWHIDHIKPLASFDLTDPEQFKQAVHYTNLQPLWAGDNIRKGATCVALTSSPSGLS